MRLRGRKLQGTHDGDGLATSHNEVVWPECRQPHSAVYFDYDPGRARGRLRGSAVWKGPQMPIHLWPRELESSFCADIEAAEFRPRLASGYIVTRHTAEVFVRFARSFLSVQIAANRQGLQC